MVHASGAIMGLDNKHSPIGLWRLSHGHTREIAIERSRDVNSLAIFEQSKLSADARVEIQKLVLTISLIESIVDVHYTGIRNGFDQSLGLPEERGVGDRSTQRCVTQMGRKRAQLSACEANQALRRRVAISVKEPILAITNVFLDQQCILRTGGQLKAIDSHSATFIHLGSTHTAELSWGRGVLRYFPYKLRIDGAPVSEARVRVKNWPLGLIIAFFCSSLGYLSLGPHITSLINLGRFGR